MNEPGATVRRFAVAAAAVGLWLAAGAPLAQTRSSGGGPTTPDNSEAQQDPSEEAEERTLRGRVEYLLSGYHFSPDREMFEGVASASEIAATLREIVQDESARPSLRTRAIDTLAVYPSEETARFLQSYLEPPGDDQGEKSRRTYRLLRLHAISSLAELHGGQKAVDVLEDLLDADRLQVRLMVISALGKHAGPAGEERLRKLAEETDDAQIEREIQRFVDLD